MLENDLGGPPLPPSPPPSLGIHNPGASTKQKGPDTMGSPVLPPHSGKDRKPWKFQKENLIFFWDVSISGFELYFFQKRWIKYVRNVFLPPEWSLKSAQSLTQGGSSENICCFCKFLCKNIYNGSLLPCSETPAYSLILSLFFFSAARLISTSRDSAIIRKRLSVIASGLPFS